MYRNRALRNVISKRHLKQLGYVNKLDIWVSCKFKIIHLTKRVDIYDSLLKCEKFLKHMITGDEKWIIYNNIERKR